MLFRSVLLLTLALGIANASLGQEPKTPEDAFAKLEGVWVAERVLSAGEQVPKEKFPFELYFEDGKLTFKFVGESKGKDRVHDLKIDASKDPHELDITRLIRDKKSTVHAIYKFEDDRLLICSLRDADGQPSEERPSSFESSSTVKSELLILKRKPASEN